jgi:methionyl-tRNA synthetase
MYIIFIAQAWTSSKQMLATALLVALLPPMPLTPALRPTSWSWRPKSPSLLVCTLRCPRSRFLATATSPNSPTTTETKPYYVTTPIFYVNAAPHVGHLYTMVLSDVLKRWQTLKGKDAILLTGTDEHGMKIQQASAKAASDPKAFCDKGAEVFKTLADRAGLSNEHFIRTTDPDHKEAVEYAWHLLQERGYIYQSKHEGWYSISDETFYPESQVHLILDPPTGRKIMASIETGKEVEWTSEVNYHFRLSAFRDKLLKFYHECPEWITPQPRMKDVVTAVTTGLEDLSISRPSSRLTWGIRVPTDPDQTIYVWLDALVNYITKAGYPWAPGAEHRGGWPADVHVIGKDILRFHCIYWPAFLMALNLPLPKRVLTHAHWTLGNQKMAKSTGNGVNPFFAIDRFGTDTMRYYMIHDGGIDNDADYDNAFIIERYKKGLQGGIGNLVSRLTRGKGWNVRRAVERFASQDASAVFDRHSTQHAGAVEFQQHLLELPQAVDTQMEKLRPNLALKKLMNGIYAANKFIQDQSPWNLVKALKEAQAKGKASTEASKRAELQIDSSIYLSIEMTRITGIMLQPVMPKTAKLWLDMLGVADERRSFVDAQLGADKDYGESRVPLGVGRAGVLFGHLTSDS